MQVGLVVTVGRRSLEDKRARDGGYAYTHQVDADSNCLLPASSVPIVDSDDICVEGELLVSTKFTASHVPSYIIVLG